MVIERNQASLVAMWRCLIVIPMRSLHNHSSSLARSPMLPPPTSPLIPESVQQELDAMEIEFAEVTHAGSSILEDAGAEATVHDSSIIHLGPCLTPELDLTIVVPKTPPHSIHPQLVLTLALYLPSQPSGQFFFNPILDTDHLEPLDDFQDVQGLQLSQTFSEHSSIRMQRFKVTRIIYSSNTLSWLGSLQTFLMLLFKVL